jgi:hypothetical protein
VTPPTVSESKGSAVFWRPSWIVRTFGGLMSKLNATHWIGILTAAAIIVAAVIGLWRTGSLTNMTSGDHSPIVNGNSAPVEIK